MKNYYLFIIRKTAFDYYKNNLKKLYKDLKYLNSLKEDDIEYAYSLFNQICEVYDTSRLKKYFIDKYKVYVDNDIFIINNYQVKIRPTRCILTTNLTRPQLFLDFKCYNRMIFAVDFNFEEYFFLCDDYNN